MIEAGQVVEIVLAGGVAYLARKAFKIDKELDDTVPRKEINELIDLKLAPVIGTNISLIRRLERLDSKMDKLLDLMIRRT